MMKKGILFAVFLVVVICCSACGSTSKQERSNTTENQDGVQTSEEKTTEQTTEETSEESTSSAEMFTTSPEAIDMNPLQQLFASLNENSTAKDVKNYLKNSDLKYHEYGSNGGFNVSYGDGSSSSRPRDRKGENLEITFTQNGTKLSNVEYKYYGSITSDYPVGVRDGSFYYRNQECSDGYEAIQLYLANN